MEHLIVNPSTDLTTSSSYNQYYYQHRCGMPYTRTEARPHFFGSIADRIRPFCRVGSLLDSFPSIYDLIMRIEVLEHLTPLEYERVIRNFCQASDFPLLGAGVDAGG